MNKILNEVCVFVSTSSKASTWSDVVSDDGWSTTGFAAVPIFFCKSRANSTAFLATKAFLTASSLALTVASILFLATELASLAASWSDLRKFKSGNTLGDSSELPFNLLLQDSVWLICCWVCVCAAGFVDFGFQF